MIQSQNAIIGMSVDDGAETFVTAGLDMAGANYVSVFVGFDATSSLVPSSVIVEGSDDDATWYTVKAFTVQAISDNETWVCHIPPEAGYRYYRVSWTASSGSGLVTTLAYGSRTNTNPLSATARGIDQEVFV